MPRKRKFQNLETPPRGSRRSDRVLQKKIQEFVKADGSNSYGAVEKWPEARVADASVSNELSGTVSAIERNLNASLGESLTQPQGRVGPSHVKGAESSCPNTPQILRTDSDFKIPERPPPLPYEPKSESSMEDFRNVRALCKRLRLLLIDVPSYAGDCMYNVVLRSLHMDVPVWKLRSWTSRWIRRIVTEENWAPENETGPQTVDEYVHGIRGCANGDHLTLAAMSDLLMFEYSILRSDGYITQTTGSHRQRVCLAYLPHAKHYMLLGNCSGSAWRSVGLEHPLENTSAENLDLSTVSLHYNDTPGHPNPARNNRLDENHTARRVPNNCHSRDPASEAVDCTESDLVVCDSELSTELGFCCQCMRRESPGLKLTLQVVDEVKHRRRYGALLRKKKECYVLCSSCFNCLMSNKVKSSRSAIPGQMYSVLIGTLDIAPVNRKAFMRIIPEEWKLSWEWLRPNMLKWCKNFWLESGLNDVTLQLEDYRTKASHDKVAEVLKSLQEYPVPTVICPMGCYAHFSEVQSLPMISLFDTIVKGKKLCDATIFTCARSNWPYASKILNWHSSGGLVVNDGVPQILFCKRHPLRSLYKEVIHLPRHPTLDRAPLHPDITAPATVVPNIIRGPRMGTWNNSSHVIKELSVGGDGLSSFCIMPTSDCDPFNVSVNDNEISDRVIFEHRPDIAASFQMRDRYQYLPQLFEKHCDLDKAVVDEALSGSSMIPLSDAYKNWKLFQDRENCTSRPTENICDTDSFLKSRLMPYKRVFMLVTKSPLLDISLALRHFCVLWASKVVAGSNNITNIVNKMYTACTSRLVCRDYKLKKVASKEFGEELKACNIRDRMTDLKLFVETMTRDVPDVLLVSRCTPVTDVRDSVVMFVRRNPSERFPTRRWNIDGTHYLQGKFFEGYCMVRPGPSFDFEKIPYRKEMPKDADVKFSLFVFCPNVRDAIYSEIKETFQKNFGNIICAFHGRPLARISKSHVALCGEPRCGRKVSAQCLSGHDVPDCRVGICLKHAEAYDSLSDEVLVKSEMRSVPLEESQDIGLAPRAADLNRFDLLDLAVGTNQIHPTHLTPIFADTCQIPIYDISRRSLPGQFYVNNSLNVLKRLSNRKRSFVHPILNSIASVLPGNNVCILFPEAMLFPRIFWKYNEELESFPGALPSYLYFEGGSFSNLKTASLRDHMGIRLRDFDSLTSRTPAYLHYWFDVIVNSALQHTTSRFIASRGLEFISEIRDPGWKRETLYSFDEETSSRKKKELCHLNRVGKWDYFLTLTCNDKLTPGVAEITEALAEAANHDPEQLIGLDQEYRSLKLSSWRRTVQALMRYLCHSPEQPIGKIKTYFLRWEFQSSGAIGNKPHVHIGVTLEEQDPEVALRRICCKPEEFFSDRYNTGEEQLKRNGMLNESFTFVHMQSLSNFHRHRCDTQTARCSRRDADGVLICRVPIHPPSKTYWYEAIYAMKMDKELEEILLSADLAEIGIDGNIQLNRCLQTGRWHYPSNGVLDKASPTIPFLVAFMKSSSNVQFCDHKFATEYLIKYCTKRESHAYVHKKDQRQIDTVALQTDPVRNFNYFSERKAQEKLDANKPPIARDLCFDEVLWNLLQYEYSESNVYNIHVSPYPPEFRGGVLKRCVQQSKSDVTSTLDLNGSRGHLPSWRKFTTHQCLLAQEYMTSKFVVDQTSRFNIRPPELVVFSNLVIFMRFFSRGEVDKNVIPDIELFGSPWVDALGAKWRLRKRYLSDACEYLMKLQHDNPIAKSLLTEIFIPLTLGEDLALQSRFLDVDDHGIVVVNTSLIRSSSPSQFLYHLCLSMGDFVTELQFGCQSTAKECLQSCGLLSEGGDHEAELQILFKKYIETELRFHPLPSQQFARSLKVTSQFFKSLLRNNFETMYTMEEEQIMSDAQESVLEFWEETAGNIKLAAQSMGIDVPTPLDGGYTADLVQFEGQTDLSFTEQKFALEMCCRAIDMYIPRDAIVRMPVLTGAPGTGKTFLLMTAAIYAISRNLRVMITSLTGERARSLGGSHFHLFLNVPLCKGSFSSPQFEIQGCVTNLLRSPKRMARVVQTDMLLLDEIGMFNSETVTVLDKVLQIVMKNSKPFGGKLLIASGDCMQLPPIDGHSLWLSPFMMTSFKVIDLKHYVRSAGDPDLRQALKLLREPVMLEEDIDELISILRSKARFVENWRDVPKWAMRIVATRQAEKDVVEKFLNDLRRDNVTLATYEAIDEICNEVGVWKVATTRNSKRLSREVLEVQQLTLYVGSCVRMTHNSNSGVIYSQGQLAIVTHLPESNSTGPEGRLHLSLVPPGCHKFDEVSPEWSKISVVRHSSTVFVNSSGQQMLRRTQWPVTLNLGSTVHKVIGQTCVYVGTELNQSVSSLRMWQREQLLVLVSRVKLLQNMFFVGPVETTVNAVRQICQKEDPWRTFIHNIVGQSSINNVQTGEIRMTPFQGFYATLPDCQCVYVLYSPSRGICYVGQTTNFVRRIRQHNGGYGAEHTREGRPWSCAALVTGFDDERGRLELESRIHRRVGQIPYLRPVTLIEEIGILVNEMNLRNYATSMYKLKVTSFIR